MPQDEPQHTPVQTNHDIPIDNTDDTGEEASITVTQQETMYSGPIPHSSELQKYKEVQENLPDRIVKMAEDDLKHIHFTQKVEVLTDSIGSILGITSALTLGLFTVYSGAQVAIAGGTIAGTILAGFGLAGILGVFIYGTRRNNSTNNNHTSSNQE